MSAAHDIYQFWINQQTVPGNIVGDVLIGAATFLIGKYKVAPWLHARHKEQLAQNERHHKEVLQAHHDLYDLQDRHHRELLHLDRPADDPGAGAGSRR
jgi:hypothetical protein